MLAPSVAMMRIPLMMAEAGNTGKWATESALAVNEKVAATAEGFFAAQMSLFGSFSQFWPEVLAGKTPSMLNGVALEKSFDAALAPAWRQVAANFKRLSRR
ncbi:MAG: hypothetical protein NTV73_02860 [Hyphomicrobiales bacterium]|nr:hypothetical protein [Hyphomicrobiales bacterium]